MKIALYSLLISDKDYVGAKLHFDSQRPPMSLLIRQFSRNKDGSFRLIRIYPDDSIAIYDGVKRKDFIISGIYQACASVIEKEAV